MLASAQVQPEAAGHVVWEDGGSSWPWGPSKGLTWAPLPAAEKLWRSQAAEATLRSCLPGSPQLLSGLSGLGCLSRNSPRLPPQEERPHSPNPPRRG